MRYPDGHQIAVDALTDVDSYSMALMPTNLGGTVLRSGFDCFVSGTAFATPQVGSYPYFGRLSRR